jgi:GT2 family glycosyltransferase
MPDKVCVIIFTCDRPDDLRRALDSVIKQTLTNIERVVINNSSDLKTDEVLSSYDVRVVKDKTKRLSYLFNLGWKSTDKEFIGYIADDAEIDKDWAEVAVNTFNKYPDAAVVTGPLVSPYEFTGEMHALYTRASKNPFLRLLASFYDKFILEGKTFEPCVLCESGSYTLGQGFKPDFSEERKVDLATTSSMMIRRSALKAIGGFDENFMFNHADGDVFVQLKKKKFAIVYNPAMRAIHYVRFGPSRHPFFIGRDTAYFYLKDIRPHSLKGLLAALTNIAILNLYWVYKAAKTKDIKQLQGILGFFKGIEAYIFKEKGKV